MSCRGTSCPIYTLSIYTVSALIITIFLMIKNPQHRNLPPTDSYKVLDTPFEELQKQALTDHQQVYTIFLNHIDQEWLNQQIAVGWELEGVIENPDNKHKYAVVFSK
jgi:hypothetical protein